MLNFGLASLSLAVITPEPNNIRAVKDARSQATNRRAITKSREQYAIYLIVYFTNYTAITLAISPTSQLYIYSFQEHAGYRSNMTLLGTLKLWEIYTGYLLPLLMFYYSIPINNTAVLIWIQ